MNLKIIHLHRDPRAILSSRALFGQMLYHGLKRTLEDRASEEGMEAYDTCNNYYRDIKFLRSSPWLRHLVVDHADISKDLLGIARAVYLFLGLDIPRVTLEWIKTQVSQSPLTREDTGSPLENMVRKNSTAVLEKWYKSWRIDAIRTVEQQCSEFMRHKRWDFVLDPYVS